MNIQQQLQQRIGPGRVVVEVRIHPEDAANLEGILDEDSSIPLVEMEEVRRGHLQFITSKGDARDIALPITNV